MISSTSFQTPPWASHPFATKLLKLPFGQTAYNSFNTSYKALSSQADLELELVDLMQQGHLRYLDVAYFSFPLPYHLCNHEKVKAYSPLKSDPLLQAKVATTKLLKESTSFQLFTKEQAFDALDKPQLQHLTHNVFSFNNLCPTVQKVYYTAAEEQANAPNITHQTNKDIKFLPEIPEDLLGSVYFIENQQGHKFCLHLAQSDQENKTTLSLTFQQEKNYKELSEKIISLLYQNRYSNNILTTWGA